MKEDITINKLKGFDVELRAELEKLKYSNSVIEDCLSSLRLIIDYMNANSIDLYSEKVGKQWLEHVYQNNYTDCYKRHKKSSLSKINNILSNRPVNSKDSHEYEIKYLPFKGTYESFIQHSRNLGQSENTITEKKRYASLFLNNLHKAGCDNLENISGIMIANVSMLNDSIPYARTISIFLKYLLEEGIISTDFTPMIRKHPKNQPLPSVYTKEEINKIESAPDTNTPMGKRDKAIILLATRNGLRASDIANLKFENIDFEYDKLHLVQIKTHDPINPILLPELKSALLDYINDGRPDIQSEYVFINTNAPFSNISKHCITHVMHRAFDKAEIQPNGRHCGPHAMRSSLNSAGVNNGLSYEEMRVINGQKDKDAIKHYAKLDDKSLRVCALDVNEPTGFFNQFLKGEVTIHE